mmetsp:Transcript_2834/g.4104  ORF Transcript_2834/g.4104 Transcript_2834/m.4104 type:complete len:112 (+) Transcript_2834:59-394(+)
MPQGAFKLKKAEGIRKKKRAPKGDQQKLKKGNHDIQPRAHKAALRQDYAAQQRITKQIVKRIESTMASRGSSDGAGLSIVQAEGQQKQEGALGKRGKGKATDIKEKKKTFR